MRKDPRFVLLLLLLIGTVVLLATGAARAQAPLTMSYQGKLSNEDGSPVSDGDYGVTFRIRNLPTGGSVLWTEVKLVTVVDGVFSTILGSSNPLDLPFDEPYWLGIQVGGYPELMPRLPLSATPYALSIAEGRAVTGLNGLTDDVTLNAGANVSIEPVGNGLTISATGGAADEDWVVDGANMYSAVYGAVGIGTPSPRSKLHVRSQDQAVPIEALHVEDLILESNDAIAGLYSSPTGVAGSGLTLAEVADGALVDKWALLRESTGGGSGLRFTYGEDKNTYLNPSLMYLNDNGLVGFGTTDPEATLDVTGPQGGSIYLRDDVGHRTIRLEGDDGWDAARITLGNSNLTYSGVGLYCSDSGGLISVMSHDHGRIKITGDDTGIPMITNYVRGWGDDKHFQVYGSVLTLHDYDGVQRIRFDGETGDKNAVVSTDDYGRRLLYCMESPEVWFEDFGTGRLVNGRVQIDLEPIFLQTVTIDDENPMQVFVTLTGDCNGIWVEQARDHFVVHELAGGRSKATFNWRVAAKKRGREDVRLEELAASE